MSRGTGFKTNGPSFCWHCFKQLQLKTGGGFHFDLVVDRDGNRHRVHKDCTEKCVGEDGIKKVTQ